MGCDVHLHVESRNDDGTWQLVRPTRAQYREGLTLILDRADDRGYIEHSLHYRFDDEEKPATIEWWDWRNYRLFWALSGVRGPDWSGNPDAVCRPGLPDDVSDEVADNAESWGLDGHSHGWMTLREAHAKQLAAADPRCWPVLLRQWTEVRPDQDLDAVRIVLWYDN